ncbi:hypothetical protein ACFY36_09950 [Actinoplanes sp. NPDC000266]
MRFKIISAALVVSFLVSGCGDSTTDTAAPAAPAAPVSSAPVSSAPVSSAPVSSAPAAAGEDELKAAVQAYSDAFLTGDGVEAYKMLSERCRKRTSQAEFTAIVDAAKQMYGSALPMETYSAQVSGDLARVTYTYTVKAINQESEPWTREAGAWHQDDC